MGFIRVGDYEPAHLSYSTVSNYRDCGVRFYLQKVAGVEQKPGLAAIGGNAAHSCFEELLHLEYANGVTVFDTIAEGDDDDTPPF